MPEPFDQELDNYEEGRTPGPSGEPAPTARRRTDTLRRCLAVGLAFGAIGLFMGGMLLSNAVGRRTTHRMQSTNNLKQIGLAIHNYHDTYDELPNNSYDPAGRPLLSWRVHILPYLEYENLYRKFKLDEPWDGPNNSLLISEMPRVYLRPTDPAGRGGGVTGYRGFSSPGAVFERRPGDVPGRRLRIFGLTVASPGRLTLASFTDGSADTILVVEAADPVPWTKPDDLDASPSRPLPKLGGFHGRNDFQALMGDGSVRRIRRDISEDTLRALVTHSGGETVPVDWDR